MTTPHVIPPAHVRSMARGLRREATRSRAAGDEYGARACEQTLARLVRAQEESPMPARRRKKPIDDAQTTTPEPKAEAKANGHVNGHANGAANGATAKPAAPPKPRQVTRYIDHKLTPAEKVQRGVEHRKILAQIDDAKASAKEDASEHKSRVNALLELERAKRIAADTGIERRSIVCEERRNEQLHQIDTVRLDTGKVVDSRPMNAEERQLVIPGTESDKAAVAEPGKKKRNSKMGAKQAEATA